MASPSLITIIKHTIILHKHKSTYIQITNKHKSKCDTLLNTFRTTAEKKVCIDNHSVQCQICKETMIYANFSHHYANHKSAHKTDTNNVPYFAIKRGKYNKIDPMYLVTKTKSVCSCGKGFRNEIEYKSCRLTHTKQCEVCLRNISTYAGNSNFECHVWSHFNKDTKPLCSKCNLKLNKYEDFCAHRSECLK
jgi:hypothetical protein